MKLRAIILLALLVVVAGLIAGSQDFPITIVDDRGKEITIEKRPQRIVVAGTPLYTEILFDIGAGSRLVGISNSPDNPSEAENITKVGPQFQPNLEMVISLEPDVVFGAQGSKREILEEQGLTVIYTGIIRNITDIFSTVRIVGKVVGKLDEANTLIGKISEEIIKIEGKVLGRPKPSVAILYASAVNVPPWVAGRKTPEDELLKRACGLNIFSKVEGYKQISFEEIVKRNPDFIFTDPDQISNIRENKFLKELKAVVNDRVFGIKASAVTSTRIAEVLGKMARVLHPKAFQK